MQAPKLRFRALQTVTSAARYSQAVSQARAIKAKAKPPQHLRHCARCARCFGTSARAKAAHDPENGGRTDQDAEEDPQDFNLVETTSKGSASQTSNSQRSRQARRRNTTDLPSAILPRYFYEQNVIPCPDRPFEEFPYAIEKDATYHKIMPVLLPGRTHIDGPRMMRTRIFFHQLYKVFSPEAEAIQQWFKDQIDKDPDFIQTEDALPTIRRTIERALKIHEWLYFAIYQECDAEFCHKLSSLRIKERPIWWNDFYRMVAEGRHRDAIYKEISLGKELVDPFSGDAIDKINEVFPAFRVQSLGDLPRLTVAALRDRVSADLKAVPPPNYDAKNWQRPISIMAMSGYGGKAVSESLARFLAYSGEADLVRIDAYDLSCLIGDYLGQNWAYGRGPLSMLGFTCAEMNGKLPREPEPVDEEDADDGDTAAAGMRAGSIEEGLQKLKQANYDTFTKWEALKIDKMLSEIIRAAGTNARGVRHRPRVLVQVDDYVELSMTVEGAFLLSRLRHVVDEAWSTGAMDIAVLGTSSCENPSKEYEAAVKELELQDNVTTRHLSFDTIEKRSSSNRAVTKTKEPLTEMPYSIQSADYFDENIKNINRMVRSMLPDHDSLNADSRPFKSEELSALPDEQLRDAWLKPLRDAILPASEIYRIAQTYVQLQPYQTQLGKGGLVENVIQAIAAYGRVLDAQEDLKPLFDSDGFVKEGPAKPDPKEETKLNDYEKRVSYGQVNKAQLKVSFSDIHVPPSTISALKLLTSLSLVRPEAFSYGVLAQDKITGCLLYGPPGTGKTMLAKAVAKESGADMLEISGAMINDKWVGESEKLIRAVFSMARKLSPCVVFLDEADALLANRTMFSNRAAHREHINQFLREWDGLQDAGAFIMVATNRPYDLDDAVLRRLPRRLLVDLPTEKDREAILKLLLRGEQLDPDVNLEDLASRTPWYSGSDLKNLCVSAAMGAVEEENAAATKFNAEQQKVHEAAQKLAESSSSDAINEQTDQQAGQTISKTEEDLSNKESDVIKQGVDTIHSDEGEKINKQAEGPSKQTTEPKELGHEVPASEQQDEAYRSGGGADAKPTRKPKTYVYPEKRTLRMDHFEKALKDIPASISEDMTSLKHIQKFDAEYGSGRGKKGKKGMGFGVVEKEMLGTQGRIRPVSSP